MIKIIVLIFSLFSSFMLHAEDSSSTYILGTGDQIRILVYDEPDLTVQLTINEDGYINFPFIGAVSVIGKTSEEVQKLIHDGLMGDYLLNPSVQVDVVSYRPFYIHGEVNQPGAYPYQPGITVDQSVALAGGFTERASKKKIYINKAEGTKVVNKKVKLTTVISAGDTITIEQSFF